MIDLPLQKQYILPPLLLISICTLLMLIDANSWLAFDRSLVEQQWWRIFTGQFMHTNWTHLGLNALGVVFIWILHAEHRSMPTYLYHIVFLALWTGVGIWLFCPDIKIYTGLSGLLHGVIIWGALKDIQVGMKTGALLFIGVWVKLIWEQIQGPSPEVGALIDSRVAIEAHLIGAVGGLVLSFTILYQRLINACSNSH
ncbi:rhombosortase [Pseudoalteromonas byunsanensis]|uniref:Rhombosortase n=1 Tax=Pseudoalteromonas byunsanensis TaxID=327939 RepID=A0A1S1NAV9_9GAMM|nr:rhombosortase [Pseudoalteromonas byunsanensis]OHU96535.1 rhombosortase [Pseudoalteromonas byunsanensis]